MMAARPDLGAVVHSHARNGVAFAALGVPLRPISHEGTLFTPPDVPRFTETGDLILTAEQLAARSAGDLQHWSDDDEAPSKRDHQLSPRTSASGVGLPRRPPRRVSRQRSGADGRDDVVEGIQAAADTRTPMVVRSSATVLNFVPGSDVAYAILRAAFHAAGFTEVPLYATILGLGGVRAR